MLTGRDTGAVQCIHRMSPEEPRPAPSGRRRRRSSPQRRRRPAAGPDGSFRDWWAFCTDEHLAAAAADGGRDARAAAREFERANWESVSGYGGNYDIAEWERGPRNAFIRGADPKLPPGQEPEPEADPQQLSPSNASTPTLSQTTVSPTSASALPGSFAPLPPRPRLQLPPPVHKAEELEAARVALENASWGLADSSAQLTM